MPNEWRPKIDRLWGQIEEEEVKIEEAKEPEGGAGSLWNILGYPLGWFEALGRMPKEPPPERYGEVVRPEKLFLGPGEKPEGIYATPEELGEWQQYGQRRWGEFQEAFEEIPTWRKIGYEIPAWATLPTAAAARAGLLAKPGVAARVGAVALRPVAAAEALPARGIKAITGRIAHQKAIKEMALKLQEQLQHQLPHTDLSLAPKQQVKMVQQTAVELVDWMGVVAKAKIKSPVEYAKAMDLATTTLRQRLKGRVSDYIIKSSRPERLLEKMDAFKSNGKMWKTFYEPLDASVQSALKQYAAGLDALKILGDKVGGKGIQSLYQLGSEATGIKLGKMPLSKLDKIAIYLYMKQPTALSHLPHTYGLRAGRATSFKQLKVIADSLTLEEKMIADTLGKIARLGQRGMQASYRYSYGKEVKLEPNYFPVKILRGPLADIGWGMPAKGMSPQSLARILFGGAFPTARIPKGFVRARTGRAIEALDRNIIDVLVSRARDVSYFNKVQPVVMDLQKLLGKGVGAKRLAVAIKQTQGNATYKVLQKYLLDTANPNWLKGAKDLEGTIRHLRSNTVVAFLGWNAVSSMKQLASWMLGATREGFKPAVKGLLGYVRDPKKTDMLLKRWAPEIHLRGKALGSALEREFAEIAASRMAAKGAAKAYWTVKDTALSLIRMTDKLAVRGLWQGAFDKMIQQGATEKEAAAYASKVIRQTQPFFSAKDLAHYWRGGELNKMLTIFTNQLNQNFNYIMYDIIGPYKAGVISRKVVLDRLMKGIVTQALIIGTISRSRPAQDLKEIRDDLAWQATAQIPLWGSMLSSGLKGFTGSGVVSLEFLGALQQAVYNANKGDWDKLGKSSLKMGALGAGVPYAQPKRTIEGILDLASGKSDDWLRLIWSEWVREQAGEKETGLPERELPRRELHGGGLPKRKLP